MTNFCDFVRLFHSQSQNGRYKYVAKNFGGYNKVGNCDRRKYVNKKKKYNKISPRL